MDSSSWPAGTAVTPPKAKSTHSSRSKLNASKKCSENLDPNVSSPVLKSSIISLNGARNSVSRKFNPNQLQSGSQKKKIRQRKFVVAKKKSGKEEERPVAFEKAIEKSKCLCVAYESLRASQVEFLKNPCELESEIHVDEPRKRDCRSEEGINQNPMIVSEGNTDGNDSLPENNGEFCETGLKRSWDRLMEEANESIPEPGSGRVMYLVQEFEKLLTIPKSCDSEEKEVGELDDNKKAIKWVLPGLQEHSKASETEVSSSSFCPSDLFLTSESLGLSSGQSFSLDSSQGSISTRTSAGGRKNRRSSTESSGALKRKLRKQKQQKETSQKPFILRTEQRGRCKEEEFVKKLQQMVEEEEKLRIPIAQGLPWTTEEPEFLVKPPVKENTKPIDLVLHSHTRAVERAEFDHQVAKKMNLIEQCRVEREKHQKVAEEQEIRRLRKELVPKAQPMPYFDRPFVPRRSTRQPTLPKEPNFHLS